jgi:carboxymethylenebutenolidase
MIWHVIYEDRDGGVQSRAARSRDTAMELISRTVGENGLVDEVLFSFTHTSEIDWMLPGIPPTGRKVETPLVA